MPFPNVNDPPPTGNVYASISDEAAADDIQRSINRLAKDFNVLNREPIKAAAVIYLGLCRLRDYSSKNQQRLGSTNCTTIMARYAPANNGGHSINCSSFMKDPANNKYIDHSAAVERACGEYVPRVKARTKRHFLLLALGIQHTSEIEIPEDDSWLDKFQF